MNVRWTERASKDALGIYDFIADQSEAYGESVYARMIVRPEQLERFPDSGSIVPEYNRSDVRELFVHSFQQVGVWCRMNSRKWSALSIGGSHDSDGRCGH